MSSAKTTTPTVECKVIRNIDWDGFINDFMENIHIIEIKPKGDGKYIKLLTSTYINLMRVGFFLLRENPLKVFSVVIQIYSSWCTT